MIKKLITFAIAQPLIILALAILFIGQGIYAYKWLPVEAFPDVDDPQVQVLTQYPGQSAEDVEAQITRPAEEQLNSTPQLKSMRSTSIFGLSVVTMTLEDDVDLNIVRANVLNQMQQVNLPPGVQWQMSSLTTSTCEVYRYVIKDPYHKIEEIRAVQDWVLEPAFRQVEGVGDFETYGGAIKQYQVVVKPERLSQNGVTLQQVFQVLQNNNLNIGGNLLKNGEQALVIRGMGLLRTVEDIGNVPVTTYSARPVYIKDVADVTTGPAPRQGITGWYRKNPDGSIEQVDDIVEAVVLNRQGTDALKVIEGIKKQVEHLKKDVLPVVLPGAQIVNTYDRTDLVQTTLHTVLHNLLLGGVLILIVSVIFTSNVRASVVIWMVIPLALLSAFVALYVKGIPANLLSFGAVDFGILVDAAVVIVEAILVAKLAARAGSDFPVVVRDTSAGLARAMLFSQLILIVALIPIFTFQRVEGRIFRPMALVFAGAIVGATLVTFSLVPLVSVWLLKAGRAARENFVSRCLRDGYGHVISTLLDYKTATLGAALLVGGVSTWMATRLGTEFLPKLDEGNIWLDVDMPLSISPDAAKENERRIRAILASFPESQEIVTQLGRPEDGYDDKGWNHIEVADYFPPHDQWTTKDPNTGMVVDKDGLIALMNAKLQQLPGCDYNFSQYIEDNYEEALSGVQGELVIKLFGDDLNILQKRGEELGRIISAVPGNADLEVEKLQGQPELKIEVDRPAVARYGTDAQTVLSLVQTGLGGQAAGNILEGQRTFALSVRLAPAARQEVARIADLWVDTSAGQRIPLKSLANIKLDTGASRIMRDYNRRRIAVKCSIRGRDMGGFVAEAQQKVHDRLKLPLGYNITWEGQFENQQRANARLMVIVPLSLLGILVLLYWAFKRMRYALLVLCDVPFAITGGIIILFLTHTNLSVSATIGFIALGAVSVQNGIILVGQFNHYRARGMSLREAVVTGAKDRVRPVMMTALIAGVGMLPMALSTGIGSEIQRPLARVIVGGMLSAVLLTLLVLPVLYEFVEKTFPAEVTAPEGMIH
ncbi:MAG: CusA/CzcA family heavy metal efflux RND transporter [Tepidisphaeraceae bacterium]|jgi:heavy metal efflux system protein